MKFNKTLIGTLGALLLAVASTSALAALATVSNENSSDGGNSLFNPDTTAISTTGDPNINRVDIGLLDFFAMTDDVLAPSNALDTIFMTVTAPTGYVITSINYFERGTYDVTDGIVIADGSLVVGGDSTDLGNPTIIVPGVGGNANGNFSFGFSSPVSIAVPGLEEVDISATNSLIAVAFGNSLANITKTEAFFEVELAPIPLPPALWMLGSAILGLVAVRRKQA